MLDGSLDVPLSTDMSSHFAKWLDSAFSGGAGLGADCVCQVCGGLMELGGGL